MVKLLGEGGEQRAEGGLKVKKPFGSSSMNWIISLEVFKGIGLRKRYPNETALNFTRTITWNRHHPVVKLVKNLLNRCVLAPKGDEGG